MSSQHMLLQDSFLLVAAVVRKNLRLKLLLGWLMLCRHVQFKNVVAEKCCEVHRNLFIVT